MTGALDQQRPPLGGTLVGGLVNGQHLAGPPLLFRPSHRPVGSLEEVDQRTVLLLDGGAVPHLNAEERKVMPERPASAKWNLDPCAGRGTRGDDGAVCFEGPEDAQGVVGAPRPEPSVPNPHLVAPGDDAQARAPDEPALHVTSD